MRRWIRSARPDAKRTIRYLPRRSTCSTRSPVSSAATSSGSSGRVSRTSLISTCSSRRPSSAGAIARRTVSTSGSSGTGGPGKNGRVDDAAAKRRVVGGERHAPSRRRRGSLGRAARGRARSPTRSRTAGSRTGRPRRARAARRARPPPRAPPRSAPPRSPCAGGRGERPSASAISTVDVRPSSRDAAQHRVARRSRPPSSATKVELGDVARRAHGAARRTRTSRGRRRRRRSRAAISGFVLVALRRIGSIRRRRRAGSRARAAARRRARTRRGRPATASAPLASSRACTSASTSPGRDARAALDVADDADRVVDLVPLRTAAGAEMERRHADGDRAQPRHRCPPAAPSTGSTTGACGSTSGSGSPPCARIQRS